MPRLLPCSAALLAASLLALPALAQDPKDAAREAYTRGEKLSEEQRYADAARAFAEADSLIKNDTALESALGAAVRAGDPVLTMTLVDRADQTGRSALPGVAEARASAVGRVGVVVVPCVTETPACVATVDASAVTTSRHWVLPGKYRVTLTRGEEKLDETVDVSASGERVITFKQPEPTDTKDPDGSGEASSGKISPLWLILFGGVTLGLGGATIAQGVVGLGIEQDLKDLQARDGSVEEQQALVDDGEGWELRTNIFIGLTAAAGAATVLVAIFAVDYSSKDEAPKAWLAPMPGGFAAGFESVF
jgi:hypothetical protein